MAALLRGTASSLMSSARGGTRTPDRLDVNQLPLPLGHPRIGERPELDDLSLHPEEDSNPHFSPLERPGATLIADPVCSSAQRCATYSNQGERLHLAVATHLISMDTERIELSTSAVQVRRSPAELRARTPRAQARRYDTLGPPSLGEDVLALRWLHLREV